MSLMASTSSFPPLNYSYNVFASFHGPDVRKTLLSHMREQFNRNGITMFDDQEIERSATIGPSLIEAIKESRISIVILSKNYASSSWCLDELVEILECKDVMGQIVMTLFYGVDPSHVRKQTGEFGISFDKTCAVRTGEERQKWTRALNEVANIAGEDFLRWDNEEKMIKKIAKDVSDKLNATPSRDFDGMVGLEAHLREIEALLDLDYVGVKIVGVTGPAGIGKTTIARALQCRLSSRFRLTCFVDNLRGSYLSGLDMLRLQEQFLSNVLKQDGIRIIHSGVIEQRLSKQRALIILDDVNNIHQLEALVNETWFGPGSRIVITTENKELLQQHGIDNTYHIGFPYIDEAVMILCRYAFKQSSPRYGFGKLALRATGLCDRLPLGLRVVGSSLREKKKEEWEYVMSKLETIVNRDIEDILRVGYEGLDEDEQALFLYIVVFFNGQDCDIVKSMFADMTDHVEHQLKILENRSLLEISIYDQRIVMHRLLQQVGKKAINKQEPWNRQILIDANDICDVLEDAKGTRKVVGISFDISGIDELSINEKAFRKMPNLRFLKVYKGKDDENDIMHIPSKMEFPRHLRLLHWEEYPSKSLPPSFHFENLVELNMKGSQLEYLWQGPQTLNNLKEMDVSESFHLKEVPDLSSAKSLEKLNLSHCKSLVEIPSTCSHLQKLSILWVEGCINLQVIPENMNLTSLELVVMEGCSRLRDIPFMSTNIKQLYIPKTAVEDVSPSINLCADCQYLDISTTDIEKIPDSIKDLHQLQVLNLSGCRRLTSLPELPDSLEYLYADDCESLETLFSPLSTSMAHLYFANCFKLSKEARKAIIRQYFLLRDALLPGKKVPIEFDHRAKGHCLTIRPDGNLPCTGYLFCVVISPHSKITAKSSHLSWRAIVDQDYDNPAEVEDYVPIDGVSEFRTEHLFIVHSSFVNFNTSEDSREIVFEFSSGSNDFDITECGAKIFTEEGINASYDESGSDQLSDDDIESNPIEALEGEK